MTEITRKRQLTILSAEFVVGTLIQIAIFFFIGIRITAAMDTRVAILEAQRIDPTIVARLEESVRNLTEATDELKAETKNLREEVARARGAR